MPSKHTFSATTDCMISERCSEITSCHLSAGPGLPDVYPQQPGAHAGAHIKAATGSNK